MTLDMHPVQSRHVQCRPSVVGGCQVEEVRGYDREEEEEEGGALVGEMRAFRGGGGRAGRSAAVTGSSVPSRYISVRLFFEPQGRFAKRVFCSFGYINEEDREESGSTSSLLFWRPLI